MPRKKLIRTDSYYYHITTRANHREWFQLPLDEVWKISAKAFQVAQKNHPANVSQYVLMGNHYHLLIRTPQQDIDKFMYYFNKEFSDRLRNQSHYENRMFGSTYKWSLITNSKYFKNVFFYIYQNPVRARIVEKCEDYPFSTLYYTYRNQILPFPFKKLNLIEGDLREINHPISQEEKIQISKGLRKSIFKQVSGKPR